MSKISQTAVIMAIVYGLMYSGQSFASSISVDEVFHITTPITVNDVKRRFGPFMKGHGPYVWYKVTDDPDWEIWFFVRVDGSGSYDDDSGIVLIGLVKEDDENIMKVLWPAGISSKDGIRYLSELYGE
ncbi:MAG: hypothetical protein QF893_13745 [Alphaproteobacteria bacterium]|nr:hypothetical protein [Alphaproteobacteria bacterium]